MLDLSTLTDEEVIHMIVSSDQLTREQEEGFRLELDSRAINPPYITKTAEEAYFRLVFKQLDESRDLFRNPVNPPCILLSERQRIRVLRAAYIEWQALHPRVKLDLPLYNPQGKPAAQWTNQEIVECLIFEEDYTPGEIKAAELEFEKRSMEREDILLLVVPVYREKLTDIFSDFQIADVEVPDPPCRFIPDEIRNRLIVEAFEERVKTILDRRRNMSQYISGQ